MDHITTSWDVIYHPFEEILSEASQAGPWLGGTYVNLLERISPHLAGYPCLSKWGEIELSANGMKKIVVFTVYPDHYLGTPMFPMPEMDRLRSDMACFLAANNLEGVLEMRVVTTVMKSPDE
jgi:hypothetical protein